MEKVKLVRNVKNGEVLFSDIKCKNTDSLLKRIEKSLKAKFVFEKNGNYIFRTMKRYYDDTINEFEIYIVK